MDRARTRFRFPLLIILVLLVALWLRVDRLDRYPPGLSDDEAMNTIDAYGLLHNGKMPLYEDTDLPEHLHRLILAAGIAVLGPSVWAFRLIQVFTGVITVAAAYWAVKQCTDDWPEQARRIGGLAGASYLAVAMPHIVLSRSLYRGLPVPLFTLLFIGFLMRGLRTNRRRHYAYSGLCLGLALHSYTAAYGIPASLGVVTLSLLIFRWRTWRDWLPGLIVLGAVFVLVIAPTVYVLLTDRDRVLARTEDVGSGSSLEPKKRIELIRDQFFNTGDINSQYNADHAPLLPPVYAQIFLFGGFVLLLRIRHPSSLMIAALLVITAYPVYAGGEIPHGLRIIGEFGVIPLVIGVTVAVFPANAQRFIQTRAKLRTVKLTLFYAGLLVIGLVGLMLGTAVIAQDRYLKYWDEDIPWQVFGRDVQHGEWFFRTDIRDLGEWLADQEEPILFPLDELGRGNLRTWLLDRYPHIQTAGANISIPGEVQIVIPWTLEAGDLVRDTRLFALLDGDTITILPPVSDAAHTRLLDGIDQAQAVWRANGDLLVRVKRLDEEIEFEPPTIDQTLAVYDDHARLDGFYGPVTLDGSAAQTVPYTLVWSAKNSINHFYSAFLQLQTQDYQRLAGDEHRIWRWLYNPTYWQKDDQVPDPHVLEIPAGLQPGAYRLVVGVYRSVFADQRVEATSADGVSLGDMPTVAWVKVPQDDMPPENAGNVQVDATLADAFTLRGASAELLDGGQLRVILYWEALRDRPAIDATIFVHALDSDGQKVGQSDSRPWEGQYPTFIWDAGERVQTEHLLTIGDTPPGEIRIIAGMYTFPDLARLDVVQAGSPAADNLIQVGALAEMVD